MPLTDGTRLEHYEIAGPLGAGGMGEVYRAVDTKLRREVALKILPPKFAADPSRLARFEREAHLLAQLNHPNIAAIYGLENADGIRFLVLELVEGPTLADRLKSGPMEVSEALGIAAQIAEAFEAAHDKGVVHRDLKPANVKITPAGKVKVLDFGLAKALSDPEPASASSNPDVNPSVQPTMTLQETKAGMVMGTAAYMSPEQAEGKPIDKRSDVWSFGVVLYEMLSGKRCFDGKTTSHIMLKLLEQEPDYTKLPDSLPVAVRYVLERCLQKDPAKRLRDVGDLRLQLEALAQDSGSGHKTAAATPSAPAQRNVVWPAATAALALAVLALGFLYFRPKPAPPVEVTRFEIPQPPNLTFASSLAISPDGRKLAFIASASRAPQLWIRSMDAVETRPLPGTEGVGGSPFWSPDSRYIVFWAQGKVQKIEAAGGPAQTLCTSVSIIFGGFWTLDDKIVFSVNRQSGLLQVSAAGGEPSPVTTLASGEARHVSPSLLPDGRHFIYAGLFTPTTGGIYLGSLDAKPDQPSKKLLPDVSSVQFAPAAESPGNGNGHLLFVRAGTLMAQPFDTKRLELSGQAVPIAEQVAFSLASNFSVAPTGSLVYRTGGGAGQQQLTWYDRQGKTLGTVADPYVYAGTSAPVLSPDGKRVAFTRTDPQSGNTDIWLFEFARGVTTRFTFDPGTDQNPVWSPDGSRIVFFGQRGATLGVYQKASNLVGGEELVYKSEVQIAPTSWSRDGKYVLYQTLGAGVSALPMDGSGEHKPIQLLPPEFNNRGARFSPDGRYFSYLSTESGRDETYVRTFDPTAGAGSATGGKWMVSKDGGGGAHWRADGKEMLYFAPDLTLMSVDVSTSPVFQAGVPKALFKSSVASIYWESTGDGQRFLLPVAVGQNTAAPYTVVLNWTALLKR